MISSNVHHRSSFIIVANIDAFVDSIDICNHTECGSYLPLNFADYLEIMQQFNVLAPHISHNKL